MSLAAAPCTDKVFLITGGTSGVGCAVATGLAALGGRVVLVARSDERGRAALADIARATGNDAGQLVVGDLASMASVKRAAEDVRRRFDRLDGLVNAAGVLSFEKRTTAEGLDAVFAVNFLAHFALTTGLLELMRATGSARVLTVAGRPSFLRRPRIDLDDLNFERKFGGLRALSQTLYAKVSFALELARRLEGSRVTSVAFHPGSVGGSNLGRDGAPWWLRAVAAIVVRTPRKDCPIAVHLATSPEVEGTSGVFFDERGNVVPSIAERDDRAQGKKLWDLSEALVAKALRAS